MDGKKKKIMLVITKASWGGAQRYVFDLADQLTDKHDITVVFGGEGLLEPMLIDGGISHLRLDKLNNKVSFFSDFKTFISLYKLFQKERPDVVHLNSSKIGIMGSLAARLAGVPRIIFTAHAWAFNEDRPNWQRTLIKLMHWFTVILSHRTITVSSGMTKQFAWPGVQKKLTVVNPGRKLEELKTRENAREIIETKIQNAEANLHDFHSDFWLGSIAELHKTKQLNRLIDAMAGLVKTYPNLRLVLIHDGPERNSLEQQVKDLDLNNHIFFTGTIPNAARLLPAFDGFVLPSLSEAFGYVLVEAGLASVPIVATKVGGITDILTDQETALLIPPQDTPALTQALKTIISDKALRHELAQKNYTNVQRFNLERMIEETERVYSIPRQ